MAAKLFSIIGDSNVRRNMTGLNVASREVMKSAEVIDYVLGTPFDQALAGVRAESSVLIVAALTDLIMTNGDCGTVLASIDPILSSIFTSIAAFCNSRPTTQVFVAPPLFRQKPRWYLQGLTQVSTRFSSVFTFNAPANLQLLPSFASQDLMPDGVHLTPVSGLHYSLHLFDQSESLLRRAVLSPESQLVQVQEQVRHHEDRMTFLESRHVGLHQQVSTKYAADAEFDDFVQNRNDEAWMNIQGLPHLTNVTRQEWPEAVKRQFRDVKEWRRLS